MPELFWFCLIWLPSLIILLLLMHRHRNQVVSGRYQFVSFGLATFFTSGIGTYTNLKYFDDHGFLVQCVFATLWCMAGALLKVALEHKVFNIRYKHKNIDAS